MRPNNRQSDRTWSCQPQIGHHRKNVQGDYSPSIRCRASNGKIALVLVSTPHRPLCQRFSDSSGGLSTGHTRLLSTLKTSVTAASQFGGLLRSVRKSRKLKIWQVAEKVDIEVKHLGRIERGERQPSFNLIIALAKCLNVSPSDFFDFDSTVDSKALRRNIDQFLSGLDTEQLRHARKVLNALF
jgi:transcriptional regulator with XRE-family HTH domain